MFDDNIHNILGIFTNPRPAGAVPLDPHAVVKHLTSSLSLSKSCFENYKLAILYLKEILIVRPQIRAKFLASRRRQGASALGMNELPSEIAGIIEPSPAEGDHDLHKELIEMLLFSIDDLIRQHEEVTGEAKPICLADDDEGLVKQYRTQLIKILKTSKFYNPEEILNTFPENKLLEERAVLLGCVGRYNRAIFIYIQNLGKPSAAEAYCDDVYLREGCHGGCLPFVCGCWSSNHVTGCHNFATRR